VLPTATGGVLDCASIDKRIRFAARSATGDLIELLMRDLGVSSICELPPETQTVLAALGKRLLLHGYAQGIELSSTVTLQTSMTYRAIAQGHDFLLLLSS
jgi:hypothetical protein